MRDQYTDAVRSAAAAVSNDRIHTAAKAIRHTTYQLNEQVPAEQHAG